ncbi:MAG: hypothetical protein K0U64_11215 [Actinomycetia bacterium]|nr:hypothetical protein [Actinomycetes bacterium]
MYESDQGIEEFLKRMGDVSDFSDADDAPDAGIHPEWLASQMRTFVDEHPEWEEAIGGFASFLARTDTD